MLIFLFGYGGRSDCAVRVRFGTEVEVPMLDMSIREWGVFDLESFFLEWIEGL